MQEIEAITGANATPTSQLLDTDIDRMVEKFDRNGSVPLTTIEAEEIFTLAEAEIKPLLRKMRRDNFLQNTLEVFSWLCIVASMVGIVYQLLTFPHTFIILYTRTIPAHVTTTLDLPTRTLAPVTITRSATIPTTGTGYQKARAATGTLTFYNGQLRSITVPRGSVFAGRDGEQITTTQDAVIPAADSSTTPPTYGYVTIDAQAVYKGASGNIAAFDINGSCCATSVIVKNVTAFTNGQDERTFKAVAAKDLQTLTSTLNATVTQAFTTAFPLQPGEAARQTNCATKTTPTHQIGEEATSVTVTSIKTCLAVAYNSTQLEHLATAAFTKTRPGATYHIVGSVQTTLQTVSPLAVAIRGKWAYTFTPDYEQRLAEKIQGDSPAKAKAYLLNTGVISYASVPNTLASADYINFFVLVG
jgi:hypothetical protein